MDYINILFNPEKVVNLNSLQNTGSGFAHSVKTTATTTINRWYSYIIYLCLTYLFFATISGIIILYIFVRFRNKIAHPFWYNQPVNFNSITNIYSLFPYFREPHVIQESLPEITKWTNYHNMKFNSPNEIEKEDIESCSAFLRENYQYTMHDNFKYTITDTEFISNFLSHNNNAYIGMYYDNKELVGLVGSFPLNIELRRNNNSIIQIHNDVKLENIVYCNDFLCIKMNSRKREIAPRIMDTLVHKVRHTNAVSKIFISKRENIKNEFVIPLTSFRFSIYKIKHWFTNSFDIHSASRVLEINGQNIHFFYSYLFSIKERFKAFVYPDMTNLVELLKQKCIFIYLILQNDKIFCSYIFKNDTTKYHDDSTIACIASINDGQTDHFFIQGFYHILEKLHKEEGYNILHLEEMSDNVKLNNLVMKGNTPFITNRSGWFLYNYNHPKIDSHDALIIN